MRFDDYSRHSAILKNFSTDLRTAADLALRTGQPIELLVKYVFDIIKPVHNGHAWTELPIRDFLSLCNRTTGNPVVDDATRSLIDSIPRLIKEEFRGNSGLNARQFEVSDAKLTNGLHLPAIVIQIYPKGKNIGFEPDAVVRHPCYLLPKVVTGSGSGATNGHVTSNNETLTVPPSKILVFPLGSNIAAEFEEYVAHLPGSSDPATRASLLELGHKIIYSTSLWTKKVPVQIAVAKFILSNQLLLDAPDAAARSFQPLWNACAQHAETKGIFSEVFDQSVDEILQSSNFQIDGPNEIIPLFRRQLGATEDRILRRQNFILGYLDDCSTPELLKRRICVEALIDCPRGDDEMPSLDRCKSSLLRWVNLYDDLWTYARDHRRQMTELGLRMNIESALEYSDPRAALQKSLP